MYTVFTDPDCREARRNRIGLVIFCRTLAGCIREGAQAGDTVIGWSSSGSARATYNVVQGGKGLRAVRV